MWAGDPPVGLPGVRGSVQCLPPCPTTGLLATGTGSLRQGHPTDCAAQPALRAEVSSESSPGWGNLSDFFFLWINTEPGFHWKGFLPVEFVLSCAFLQEWHCKRYLLLLSLKCLSRFAPSQPYRQAAYSYLKTQYTETRITAVQPTHSCLQDKHVHQWSPGGNEVFSFLFFFSFRCYMMKWRYVRTTGSINFKYKLMPWMLFALHDSPMNHNMNKERKN